MLTRKLINPITNSHNIKTLSPSKNHIMNKKIRIKEIEINTMRAKKKNKKKQNSNENGKKKKKFLYQGDICSHQAMYRSMPPNQSIKKKNDFFF